MSATPENLMTLFQSLPEGAVWQVVAIGRANLQLSALGIALGGNARAGLEDTLYLRKGRAQPGNRPLVERTVGLVRAQDLHVATVEETEKLLGLPPR